MGNKKPFSAQRIAQSLAILDTWRASVLPLKAFATAHQLSYDQLRAWLRHEPRWRDIVPSKAASQPNKDASPPSIPVGVFQRVQVSQPTAYERAQPLASSHSSAIRIECANASMSRSASVHFHGGDLHLSAQWLAAFMSA
ncbi:MAG: hypothetical protein HC765_15275 [Brachymonas sp.]|nr:hypothetical protein [Brachymonas sp.]